MDERLDLLRKNNPKSKVYHIEGNHEYRVAAYEMAHPALRGFLNVSENMGYDKKNVTWVPYWSDNTQFVTAGKLNFIHGKYVQIHHAKAHADKYGANVMYGHTHSVQEYTAERQMLTESIMAASIGCLCKIGYGYMRGHKGRWQQAFATVEVQPDGKFNHYIHRIFEGKFVGPDGVTYNA